MFCYGLALTKLLDCKIMATPHMNSPATLIIGAGISGLSCAQTLQNAGHDCLILDKARGPGGRISSKRTEQGAVDLGAQYFTARDAGFRAQVEQWITDQAVATWHPKIAVVDASGWVPSPDEQARYVGTPKMGSLAHHLAKSLRIQPQSQVTAVMENHVILSDGRMLDFERLVIACPADQAQQLLPDLAVPIQAPCWALWVDIEGEQPFDAAFVKDSSIGWVAKDSSKPGRNTQNRWVVHPTPEFSQEHLEEDPAQVSAQLLMELQQILPNDFQINQNGIHRWRYARPWPKDESNRVSFLQPSTHIWVCGDYCLGGRVEGAWLSGQQAAQSILAG